jgi:ABC-type antimicrobial peptide transport system permease subunit
VIPEAVELSVNPRVLGFTFAIAVGSGLLFSLAPASQALHPDTVTALRDEGGTIASVMSLFAAVALVLAVVGLYGVMAQAATQRTVEIGIRLALGAQRASMVALLMGRGVRLLAIGVAIGL